MRRFWEIRARADDPARGEMTLYGEISDVSWFEDEVTPARFAEELKGLGEIHSLDIYINSPGGDVFAGLAIYNALRRLEGVQVTAHVDGLAASAASVVVMAADRIVMPKNALLMIHRAWAHARGNAEDMTRMADRLEQIDGQLAQIYADRTGQSRERMAELMAEETWMCATQAAELGMCDEIEANKAAACVNITADILARYHNAPEFIAGTLIEDGRQAITSAGIACGYISMDKIARNHNAPVSITETCNGGESQPVEDKKEPLTAEPAAPAANTDLSKQRRRFDAVRRKIMNAMGGKAE